jgi:hypothetical protein
MKTNELTTVQQNYKDLEILLKTAEFYAKAGLVPVALKNKPYDIMMILKTGREYGFDDMQSFQSIDAIMGTIAIKPKAMLGLIYKNFPDALVDIDSHPDYCNVLMARSKDDKPYPAKWDLNRARTMGLLNKDNWKKQAQTMLKWRAIGEAAQVVFSDITKGLYNSEEARDLNNIQERLPPRKVDTEIKQPENLMTNPMANYVNADVLKENEVVDLKTGEIQTDLIDVIDEAKKETGNETITKMLLAFKKVDVTPEMIEKKFSKKISDLNESNMNELREILGKLIKKEIEIDEIFVIN